MNRNQYIQSIFKSLSWVCNEVKMSNKQNLTDININSENFYRDLLNLALGVDLINANSLKKNADAIDLFDADKKFAIQVTSTSTLKKTKSTVEKFIENKLYLEYPRLIILNIVKKSKHKERYIGDENFKIDTEKDIWDIDEIMGKIMDLRQPDIQKIKRFLDRELYMIPDDEPPKNVQTILKLIDFISNEEHPDIGKGFLEEPFPDEKINERFKNHSQFLKDEYLRLFVEYGAVLREIERHSSLGVIKIRRAAEHLRSFSDNILNQNSGNPKSAMEEIIQYFIDILGKNGFSVDTGAVRFYIVDQLIKCNLFPNEET